jgi:hypothetical protein
MEFSVTKSALLNELSITQGVAERKTAAGMAGKSCSRREASVLRAVELRPSIPHRPAKDRCAFGEFA